MRGTSNVYSKSTPVLKQIFNNNPNSNYNRLIFGHLNRNSLRSKFDLRAELFIGFADPFLISESKTDDSFTKGQFIIDGYHALFEAD